MSNKDTKISYCSINVSTGSVNDSFECMSDEQVSALISVSADAYASWRETTIGERANLVNKVAKIFEDRAEELGALITNEMGKPLGEAREEASFCGAIFRYFAQNAAELTSEEVLEETEEAITVLERCPVGPLLGIMPWNYPYYQVARFVAPNLMLGNTIILKHSESVPKAALRIQEIMEEAGIPKGVYQNIFADHQQVSEIIDDPRVQGVSLTGSERAGASVAAQSGKALKKVVLELGGSDPYIVLSSDNIRQTVQDAIGIRLENTGQACNSNKRIIVHADIYDEFVAAAVEFVRQFKPSFPQRIEDPVGQKRFGPMSSEKALEQMLKQIHAAKYAGATVHLGGQRAQGEFTDGYFLFPAVITDIPVGSDIYYEEFFGPVVTIYKATSDEQALKIANDTQYGLGASVYALEKGRAELIGNRLEAGMVGINKQPPEAEDMPFGGVKRSGYGRELGRVGMDEFVNKKLVSRAKV